MNAPISHPVIQDPLQAFKANVLPRLRDAVRREQFEAWFGGLQFSRIEHGTAHLTVPTSFLRSWINAHFETQLLSALAETFDGVERYHLSVRGAAPPSKKATPLALEPASVPTAAAPAPPRASPRRKASAIAGVKTATEGLEVPLGCPLDPRYTFESFSLGPSNSFAHAAALQLMQSEESGIPPFTPLYLQSEVGLGKTHLMQALAGAALERGREVLYLTADRFIQHAAGGVADFMRKLDAQSGVGLLLVDDLQFLRTKTATEGLSLLIDSRVQARRSIILAADRVPSDLELGSERLQSRLNGGLVASIKAPDLEERRGILARLLDRARAGRPGLSIPDEVVEFVSNRINASGRDLEGAANRLVAHASYAGRTITLGAAELAIADLVTAPRPVRRPKIEEIQKAVASHFNVSQRDILSNRRTANVVLPRQTAMYLAKVMTLRSLPEIGRRFGGRDHTTVLHAVRKIEKCLADGDNDLGAAVRLLVSDLETRVS